MMNTNGFELIEAIEKNNISNFKRHLNDNAGLGLKIACEFNRADMVEFALENTAFFSDIELRESIENAITENSTEAFQILISHKDKFSNNQLSEALKFSYDKGKLDMFKQLLTLEEVNPIVDNNYCFNKAYMAFKDDYMNSLLENKVVRDLLEKNKPDVFKEVLDGRTIRNQGKSYYQANTNTTFVADPSILTRSDIDSYVKEFAVRTPVSINELNQSIQAGRNKSKIKANLANFDDMPEPITHKVSRLDQLEHIAILGLIKLGAEPNPELVNKTIAAITVENKFTDFNSVEEGVVLKIPTLKTINQFVVEETPVVKPDNSPSQIVEKQSHKKKLKL